MTDQAPITPPQDNKQTRMLLLAILLIGILLTGIVLTLTLRQMLAAPEPVSVPGVSILSEGRELMDFTLPSSSGDPLSLSDLRGSYALVFFGYTHCPDFCPLTLAEFKQVKTILGDDADNLNFLFVSVDGPRDTPEALARFLGRFDSEFIGMSGDDATLLRIGPDYGLYYERHTDEGGASGNYPVDHSTASYLIDPDGKLRVIFSYSAEPDVVAENVLALMRADGNAGA
jgi:protein SCO1/2